MQTLELEKTYLAKYLPDLTGCESKEIVDIYVPKSSEHPTLRIRKNGTKFEITKKFPVQEGDASAQTEHTIILTEQELLAVAAVDGKRIEKQRYLYHYVGRIAEIDVFQGNLKGLVLVDFEFDTQEEKDAFTMPDFCLVDVTQEEFIAGGMLCGKSYVDIEDTLGVFGYKKILD